MLVINSFAICRGIEMREKITAIVLAGGQGQRMQSEIPKQYLLLNKKIVLGYSLIAFERSRVDEIILVTGEKEKEYCKTEIIEPYGISKVKKIVAGGAERYHSVYAGLKSCKDCSYVLIHDGARPFLSQDVIERAIKGAMVYSACVVGMPVKDTIKICDTNRIVKQTPLRERLFMVQTPQSFEYTIIEQAYHMLIESGETVTDDAMAVEKFLKLPVKVVEGSYENIKITTPEDLEYASFIASKYDWF